MVNYLFGLFFWGFCGGQGCFFFSLFNDLVKVDTTYTTGPTLTHPLPLILFGGSSSAGPLFQHRLSAILYFVDRPFSSLDPLLVYISDV